MVVEAETTGRVEADGGVRVHVVSAAERLVLDAVDRRHAESRRVFHLLQSNDNTRCTRVLNSATTKPHSHEPPHAHLCESCPLGQQLATRTAPRRVEIDEPDLIVRLSLHELVEGVVIEQNDGRVQRVLATHANS